MPWLSALLTAPHPLVEALQSPEKAALFISVVGGAVVTVAVTAYVKISKAKRELAMLAVPPTAPMPLPPPAPAAHPPHEDLTASRIRQLHLDTELAEAQAALGRLRHSQNLAAFEQAQYAKTVFELRAENEGLRAEVVELKRQGAALVEEMRRLRSDPPPPRGPRHDR